MSLSLLRRHRALLVVVGLLVTGLALLVVLGDRDVTPSAALEPGNPDPQGARALAQVLGDRGVRVSVAHGQEELAREAVDEDTTVFVTSTGHLSAYTSRRLRELTSRAGTLVLAGASPTTIRTLDLGVHPATGWPEVPVPASCEDPLLAGLELDVPPTTAYTPADGVGRVQPCFPVESGDATSALVARVTGRPDIYLVGAVELFSNQQITAADDAAAALRLLGGHDRLVWYVADAADVPPGDAGSLRALLPPWLGPATALLGLTMLTVMVWRGRRLGPLVVEPLPVVVKAVESTTSRGRLYSQARAREHAAAILRDATVARLAEHLKLPRGSGPAQLVPLVAQGAGRSQADVRRLLEHGPVPDDRTLTMLAHELAELEREVRLP